MHKKSSTLAIRSVTKEALRIGKLLYPERYDRPQTRADCARVPRPCPFVGCKWNLYLDVSKNGSILFNNKKCEPWEVTGPSCALDVADAGQHLLEEVGSAMNFTRERARQVEIAASIKIRALGVEVEYPDRAPIVGLVPLRQLFDAERRRLHVIPKRPDDAPAPESGADDETPAGEAVDAVGGLSSK